MVHERKIFLSSFARTLATGLPVQRILDQLVERAADVLPVAAAGASVIGPDNTPSHVAATSEAALHLLLQTEQAEGLRCLVDESGESMAVPDLSVDQRLAPLVDAATPAGLASVHAFPLRHGGGRIGALYLYSDAPGELDRRSSNAAQILADVTGAYLLNARAGEHAGAGMDVPRQSPWHDPLTGLPNRLLLRRRLETAARRAETTRAKTAILFVNLDQFNRVNHVYGHQVGDNLLRAVAHRLSAIVRIGDTLARVAGDEFVFLCEEIHGETDAGDLAERIQAALFKPFVLGAAEIKMTACVGVALAGPDDDISDQLVISADTAMRQAKREGGGGHRFIDQREASQSSSRHGLEADLREALAADKFDVAYQPIVRCADGRMTGVEALLRWTDPRWGAVAPETIIAVAEQSRLINDIGAWVLERACRDRCEWLRKQPGQPLDLAVNVSARQLMSPDFSRTVAGVLARTGMVPTALVLEITEQILIEDIDRVMVVLTDLRKLGIRLALDDFGTGYSSLGYLRQLPIDIVKIDQSFVSDIGMTSTGSVIVSAVTHLAHVLGLTVTSEGVETAAQRDEVRTIGCDDSQGYFHARPMPAAGIRAHLSESADSLGGLRAAAAPLARQLIS